MDEQLGCQAWPLPWLVAHARPVHSLVHDGVIYFWSIGYAGLAASFVGRHLFFSPNFQAIGNKYKYEL